MTDDTALPLDEVLDVYDSRRARLRRRTGWLTTDSASSIVEPT